MASEENFVEYVVDQMENAGLITFRKMFGEYCVYCEGKVVALICDNKLFVKPTDAGRKFIGKVSEGYAYPGAKVSFQINEQIEDKDWLSNLIKITEHELPSPKPKKNRKKKKNN